MRTRVAFVVLAGVVGLVATGARAATDTNVVAQGNGVLSYGSPAVNCTGPVAVTFTVASNQGFFSEAWGPGSPGVEACALGTAGAIAFADNAAPGFQQCTPVGVGLASPSYTLTQSGTTYTLQASMRYCNGVNALDKIVVTVRAGNITFTHTFSENGVVRTKGTGTIPRIA